MTMTTQTAGFDRAGLCIEPLDMLFFRDGRPFGGTLHGQSRFPLPQTFAGAIRTHLLRQAGCDFARLKTCLVKKMPLDEAIESVCGAGWIGRMIVRGPWLARLPSKDRPQFDVLVPMPSTLHWLKDASARQGSAASELVRLDPLSPDQDLPGWQPSEKGIRPLWPRQRGRTERAEGFLTPDGLRAFLEGQVPKSNDMVKPKDLYDFDRRTGIGIDPDRLSAEESMIYTASFLVLKPGVRWYVEIDLPPESPADMFSNNAVVSLGGEGRQARLERVERFSWPEASPSPKSDQAGRLLLLTTPGLFEAGWRPKCLSPTDRLVAASVPGHLAVLGWDLARGGPKPARFAVPAGSVYFISNSLDTLPRGSLADRPEDVLEGWGCYLKGAWNYVGNKK